MEYHSLARPTLSIPPILSTSTLTEIDLHTSSFEFNLAFDAARGVQMRPCNEIEIFQRNGLKTLSLPHAAGNDLAGASDIRHLSGGIDRWMMAVNAPHNRYFDCQGIISRSENDLAERLPRYSVSFQRLDSSNWVANTKFPIDHIMSGHTVTFKDDARGQVNLTLDMESWKGFLRSGLQLRATDSNASHNRIFRIPVFAKLNQITELQGDELCDAWLQCIFCHYRLWKKGVRHRDVSCGNLMYYRCSNQVKSVLNDFDLASMDGVESRGHQRTGTPPFMATDLLINSQTKHLYRHDLESFIWVWVWLTLQFKDGELRSGQRPLDAWAQCSARQCAAEKKLFLSMVETYADDQINEEHWKLVMELCCKLESPLNNIAGLRKQLHLARQYHKQDEKKIKGQLAEAEDDGNFFRWFLEVLRFSDQPQFTPPSL